MGFIVRVKTWVAEKLYYSDLNAEFNNILSGLNDGTKDINVAACNVNGTFRAKGDSAIGDLSTDTLTIVANVNAEATNIAVNVLTMNAVVLANVDVIAALVPIGSIIPHYDFNANLTAQINTTYWAYCNGQAKTINGVSETLPDMSGRYLVGYGVDGDGNNDDATYNATVTGRAGHLSVTVAHTHTGPSHQHTGPSHTHAQNTDGTAAVSAFDTYIIATSTSGDRLYTRTTGGLSKAIMASGVSAAGTGNTGAAGTGATGPMSTGLTTLDIQPRSIRVRYIMRIK